MKQRESMSFSTVPGTVTNIRSGNTLTGCVIGYPDGSEIRVTIPPNGLVSIKIGTLMAPTITFVDADDQMGDIRIVE